MTFLQPAIRIIQTMFHDRKLPIVSIPTTDIDFTAVPELSQSTNLVYGFCQGYIAVIFLKTINKTAVDELCHFAERSPIAADLEHYVVVHENKCTSLAAKQLHQKLKSVEVFSLREIELAPPQFGIVPKYRLLSAAEVETHRFTPNKLPRLLTTDPMARYLNAQPGQIYEITQRLGCLQHDIMYRVVTEPVS